MYFSFVTLLYSLFCSSLLFFSSPLYYFSCFLLLTSLLCVFSYRLLFFLLTSVCYYCPLLFLLPFLFSSASCFPFSLSVHFISNLPPIFIAISPLFFLCSFLLFPLRFHYSFSLFCISLQLMPQYFTCHPDTRLTFMSNPRFDQYGSVSVCCAAQHFVILILHLISCS